MRVGGFLAFLPFVVLPFLSGCTVIGYQLGQTFDESLHEVQRPEELTEQETGRPIEIVTMDGLTISGRLRGVVRVEEGIGIHVQQIGSESLFRTEAAFEDTIPTSSIGRLRLGGAPGNGASIGGMCGIVADVLVMHFLLASLSDLVGLE